MKLGEITIAANTQSKPTDYADPKPTTDWGIDDIPSESGTMTTTGETTVQATPPDQEPPNSPWGDLLKTLAKISISMGVTFSLATIVTKLTQAERDQLKNEGYILPTMAPDPSREPLGTVTVETNEGEIGENEAARFLAKAGFDFEQNRVPDQEFRDVNSWMREGAKPDYYSPNSNIYLDCFTPEKTKDARGIAKTLAGKSYDQARHLVLYMKNSTVLLEDIKEAINLQVPNSIKQVLVVTKDGNVILLYP